MHKGEFEIVSDKEHIIAYSSPCYKIGKIYEERCNCYTHERYTFGLIAQTKELSTSCFKYHKNKSITKVLINLDDIGYYCSDTIRCFKFKVLEEIKF